MLQLAGIAVLADKWSSSCPLRQHAVTGNTLHPGVLVGLCAYQAHRQQLQPARLRRIPVIGPWLVHALRRLSTHREQPGDARQRAGQAAARRVRHTPPHRV